MTIPLFEEVRGQSGRENVAVGYPPVTLPGTILVISLISVRPSLTRALILVFTFFQVFHKSWRMRRRIHRSTPCVHL